MVRALLALGADPNSAVGSTGSVTTPLLSAIYWRHVHVVEELLAKGADPNLLAVSMIDLSSGFGCYPAAIAVTKEYPEILALLLSRGAVPRGATSFKCLFATAENEANVSPGMPPPSEIGVPNISGIWDLDYQRSGKGKRSRLTLQIDHIGKYLLVKIDSGHDFWGLNESLTGYTTDNTQNIHGRERSSVQWVDGHLSFKRWSAKKNADATDPQYGPLPAEILETWKVPTTGSLEIIREVVREKKTTISYLKRIADVTNWRRLVRGW